ncbi:MAG: dihydrodipicolinate synthase family protein [Acidimicrobiia bacterium]|nr:dihydrodipicolinate synthase family protein [Acidimicrobiia bacterium]MDH4307207.1 dihydrodipicolinate synthase family protein [Acidimicrobiia bacterium]MDH5292667.1 dihydrodipicolinate synthase family protein [Acidimicrobiia bacterium]
MLSAAKETAFEKVRGLWVAIPTPFAPDGSLDEMNVRASVEHYVSGLGVDGIFCGGVMGEFWSMTMAERFRLHEIVADTVAGRIPIMAQTSHHVFSHCVELGNHAEEKGFDLAIVMNPYYPPKPSDDQVRAWYQALDRETTIPTFLFNTSYSGYALSPEVIIELADIDIICGIKNPKPPEHFLAVLEGCGDTIVVCDAAEDDWLDYHLDHGVQALMSTPALAMFQTPEHRPIAEYTALADAGRIDEARSVSASLSEHRKAFDRWMRPFLNTGAGPVPIANLKAWLTMMGLPQGPVRLPLLAQTAAEEAELRADLERLGLTV